jgi:hypothetical protein
MYVLSSYSLSTLTLGDVSSIAPSELEFEKEKATEASTGMPHEAPLQRMSDFKDQHTERQSLA